MPMKPDYSDHFRRIKDAVNNVYTLKTLSKWVEKHVYLEGKPLDFSSIHYFQREILDDTARINNVVKPAQIGITTVTIAYMLAALATQRRMHVIYALPSASDAQKMSTTKINPLMYNSPEVARLLNSEVNSSELKQIGENFLYIRGTKSETAALSVSADILVLDELDRCDPDTVKQFRSRLQASPHKIIRQFSTPTIEGIGISKEAETSRRYRHFATCKHCDHTWLPTFHKDINIPGCELPMEGINRTNLKDINWRAAHWQCPTCFKDPELHMSRLRWVCENPADNYEANTYYITPVTAYGILTPSYLVQSSTEFNKRSEFLNQVLGETASEDNDQLTLLDVEKAQTTNPLDSNSLHYFGADMGLTCTVAIGRLTLEGQLIVVHREQVPLMNFELRRRELCAKYRCLISVHDAFPYTDLVERLTSYDKNAYGAIFTTTKSTEMYAIQSKEETPKEGKLNLRLAKINRTIALDAVLAKFKRGEILLKSEEHDSLYAAQYLDMRRAQVFDKNQEIVFQWQKSSAANDHGMFALLYLLVACKLAGTAAKSALPKGVPLVSSFKMKDNYAGR
jgi:Phage terminase large subunit (GpA)